MKLLKFYYSIISLVLISSISQAGSDILLISDIDDTIKESHVLSDFDKIGNAFDTDEPFKGMSQLYRFIKMDQPGIEFHYVSNAPEFLMKDSHQKFISRNLFPNGQMHLSEKIDSTGHKVRVISNLIETRHPHTVIMLGDNGERDVFVQDTIVRKYAKQGIRFIQFIRVAYTQDDGGKALLENQTGFITAGEIALVLMEQTKLISMMQLPFV